MSVASRFRHLRDQLGELAAVDWRDPTWWGFAAVAVAADVAADSGRATEENLHRYLSANGGPRSDNYMGRDAAPPADLATAIAHAVLRARAALDAVAALDGTLPEQPTQRVLAWRDGWLEREPAPAEPRAAFATPRGAFVATLSADNLEAVATALGAAIAGRTETPRALTRVDPASSVPTDAVVAAAIGLQPLAYAQHVHRATWTAGGGPWLGVGFAPPIEVVTTCHVVVDGYGHGLVTRRILDAAPAVPLSRLVAAAKLGLGGTGAAVERLATPATAEPLSFAGRVIDGSVGRFPELSYAYGRAIERTFCAHLSPAQRRAAKFSPTFQVPVAPGRPGDPDRRTHRVVHGLLAVRMSDGEFEPYEEYAARLRAFVTRETASRGVISRLQLGTASVPMPLRLRRYLLQSRHRTHDKLPQFEVLAGRGRFSSMKFPPDELVPPPLYAVSSPTLLTTPDDPLGAVVLTLMHHADGCTATASGTGAVGSDQGASAFLDTWLDELAIVRSHGAKDGSGSAAARVRGNRGGLDH